MTNGGMRRIRNHSPLTAPRYRKENLRSERSGRHDIFLLKMLVSYLCFAEARRGSSRSSFCSQRSSPRNCSMTRLTIHTAS
jgi:hypothetical protein